MLSIKYRNQQNKRILACFLTFTDLGLKFRNNLIKFKALMQFLSKIVKF